MVEASWPVEFFCRAWSENRWTTGFGGSRHGLPRGYWMDVHRVFPMFSTSGGGGSGAGVACQAETMGTGSAGEGDVVLATGKAVTKETSRREVGPITRVRGTRLVKTFGATAALRGVDVELLPGLTLVEGANGSGKTTLLRVLGMMLRPSSGSLEFEPLGPAATEVRRAVGWVSHEPLAYGDLSGRANIGLAAALLGLAADEAWRRVEERFELGRFAERAVRTMSRGQRQRVALARALVHEPSLILLDEPTTGLDKSGVARLLEVLKEELGRGALVAVVTHEPRVFDVFSPVRVELERGRVIS